MKFKELFDKDLDDDIEEDKEFDELIKQEKQKTAEKFVNEVKKLAAEYKLNFFVATDNAWSSDGESDIINKHINLQKGNAKQETKEDIINRAKQQKNIILTDKEKEAVKKANQSHLDIIKKWYGI